jgi:hypothetical protein
MTASWPKGGGQHESARERLLYLSGLCLSHQLGMRADSKSDRTRRCIRTLRSVLLLAFAEPKQELDERGTHDRGTP